MTGGDSLTRVEGRRRRREKEAERETESVEGKGSWIDSDRRSAADGREYVQGMTLDLFGMIS
jgi:hypothetical protein